ncbi:lipopolysaccharide transport system ATP-binding protein [Rhizobiales bacterium GAS113]|nr:lipopolysaccharide transport system ATP-binding protein [Rhizobiales bacterium GAS113]
MQLRETGHLNLDVGITGTFDVENYGDLLFPLIAGAALARREPRIRIVPISANGKSKRSWPFDIASVSDIHNLVPKLAAMLIGGGQIVRFDTHYPVRVSREIKVPIAYWLLPAVLAAAIGKPVIWNAVGAWTGSPPAPWYTEVIQRVLAASHFIGARDVASQVYLSRLAPKADIQPLPDTAFSLSRVWPLGKASDRHVQWRRSLGIATRYVVIQANPAIATYRSTIETILRSFKDATAVVLPICWCHGDRAETFPALDARVANSSAWLHPKLISEIIARSELVIASSLHACITGLSYGVPVVRAPVSPLPADRKFELLSGFESIALIDDLEAIPRLLERGKRTEPRVVEIADRLDRYWDDVARTAVNPHPSHRDHAMSEMLGWLAGVCNDIGQSPIQAPPVAGSKAAFGSGLSRRK